MPEHQLCLQWCSGQVFDICEVLQSKVTDLLLQHWDFFSLMEWWHAQPPLLLLLLFLPCLCKAQPRSPPSHPHGKIESLDYPGCAPAPQYPPQQSFPKFFISLSWNIMYSVAKACSLSILLILFIYSLFLCKYPSFLNSHITPTVSSIWHNQVGIFYQYPSFPAF